MKKTLVYLCDFFHNYLGTSTSMFPLNIGYVAAYALHQFPQELDIELFKHPQDFVRRFKECPSDIVGFSDYTWNADINQQASRWVKERNLGSVVVFGGPNITYSPEGKRRFFETHSYADFFLPYQGEIRFADFLKTYLGGLRTPDLIRQAPPDGILAFDRESATVIEGVDVPRVKELDTVPSPYLTGLLDGFFETALIPIVETNRGCPYRCTFCAQGESSFNKLNYFSLDRVKDEITYIAQRVKKTNILNFADANFGIAHRDMEIAEFLATLPARYNYPRKFNTNWAKNQPKLFEMAKILSNCNLVISLQSLDEAVLENVKRTNIRLDVFREIIGKINAAKGISGTEIILGLPGETKASHIETLRKLFDWNVSYLLCYNALILEGTEMSRERENHRLGCQTKFRLMDNGFGEYDTILSMEVEEGIRETQTMSEDDILFFRPVHWLIQFFWNYRFYYPLMKFLQTRERSPLDLILNLVESAESPEMPEAVRRIFARFHKDANEEWFDTKEDLLAYYSARFKALKDGEYGKMNGKYIFHVLTDAKPSFDDCVLRFTKDMLKTGEGGGASDGRLVENLVQYCAGAVLPLGEGLDRIRRSHEMTFDYDILAWVDSDFNNDLAASYSPGAYRYRFYLPTDQWEALDKLMKQYAHPNKNVTLRKMTEFMDIRDIFYRLERL